MAKPDGPRRAAMRSRAAKRRWLKAIRGLLQAAVPTMRRDDPTEGIAGIKMANTKGHHHLDRTHLALGKDAPLGRAVQRTLL